jgi:3-(3-hydroxy-phenyl)propionate hydroxylase
MDADVIVVGCGPCGATLAGLLGQRGVRVLVIEKSRDVFAQPRAAHIDHTGLRTIQQFGFLEAVLPAMIHNQSLDLVNHAHELLMRLPAGQKSVSNLPTSVYFYQPELDRQLRAAISAIATVDVRLGHEWVSLSQNSDCVDVRFKDAGGNLATARARWLVGCDGSWSPVRESIGCKLDSLGFDERWLVLDLRLYGTHRLLPSDRAVQVCDPKRPHLTMPISENRQRFEFMLLPGDDADAIALPKSTSGLLASWLQPDTYTVERSAIYTFHGLIADGWRSGRVLIAGDAAHQMPPFLGQGMCSGLRDAANLSWKLAAVIRDGAPESILDTYEAERSPHVRQIIEAAIEFGRLVCITDPAEAAIRDERFLIDKTIPESIANFSLPRLIDGPLVGPGGGALFVQPEIDGRRLDDVVRGRFLVVSRTMRELGQSRSWWEDTMGAAVIVLETHPSEDISRWMLRFKAGVAVVRPDRYVLATGSDLDAITRMAAPQLCKHAAFDIALRTFSAIDVPDRSVQLKQSGV